MTTGDPVDATGVLVREGGAFHLCCEDGGRLLLDLGRTPIDAVQKRVRVIGTCIAPGMVEADGVQRL